MAATMSVPMQPGEMVLTVTPALAPSCASAIVKPLRTGLGG